MESFIFQIFSLLVQMVFQVLGVLLQVCVAAVRGISKALWTGTSAAVMQMQDTASSRESLVLGPGESLKPGCFDYSQTATFDEVEALARMGVQQPGLWLGQQIEFKKSRSKLIQREIWLPRDFLLQHVLVVGPPGAGKTELLMKSARSLMQHGNLVYIDAAGFLEDALAPIAKQNGSQIMCWDVGAKQHQVVWNFLEELEHYGREQEVRAIAEALYGKFEEEDKNAAFWNRDIMWLTAILGTVVEARRKNVLLNPSDLSGIVANRSYVQKLLNSLPQARTQWEGDLSSYLSLSDQEFANQISFLQTKLSPFKDPSVKRICDGISQLFVLPALNGQSKCVLIIGQSLADGKLGSALASVMTAYIMKVMFRRMRNPKHNWVPTYLVCDEAARLKVVDYEELTAIGRNAKVGAIIMCQSIDQFSEKVRPTLNNCRTQLFLQGVSYQSAEWLSQQLGESQRKMITETAQRSLLPSSNRQRALSYQQLPILGVREISDRPYSILPSNRSAIVRVSTAMSPTTKPFLTDYYTHES